MSARQITWQMVDATMDTFRPTTGGYSLAKRGIITLADGTTVFIKLATDADSKRFIAKELVAYKWLKQKGYLHIPEILLEKQDGFILPDLSHLDWSNRWNAQKVDAVFQALDELSSMALTEEDRAVLSDFDVANGWQELVDEPKYQEKLLDKLADHPGYAKAIKANIQTYADVTEAYLSERDQFALTHSDVRSDNLAYNPKDRSVQLIDWNWMGMGRKGIEEVALLVDVAHSGFTVEEHCAERLDPIAALVLAGFWFSHSTRRIWEGGNPQLRELQFKSALQSALWAKL
ncbi:MAG: phosphotransferase [Candidatus Saccharimonadales bacterium]